MSRTTESVDFFDPATNDCPYRAYRQLRDESPVWQDPTTGMYVLTRYEDVRSVLMDTERFTNTISTQTVGEIGLAGDAGESREHFETQQRNAEIARLYDEEGWTPGPALNARDEPEHFQVRRALFEPAFRRSALDDFDPIVERTVRQSIDGFVDRGRVEWVDEFAAPMTLAVILTYLGLPLDDLDLAKEMTVTWIARAGLMSPEVEPRAAQLEVRFQKYLQGHFDRLRGDPDGTLLSRIVNTPVPEWGRVLTDEELHGFITTDMLVGGAETTTGGLAAGARMLAERPELFAALAAEPDRYLDTFVEEVVRLESPVAGMFRQAAVDVEFHGVVVPAGAVVQLRYASANRDDRQYPDPERLDLDRLNARRHVGFGTGNHVCLGATLARREMWHTFKAMTERFATLRLAEPAEVLRYRPNYVVRCLNRLDLEFTPRTGA